MKNDKKPAIRFKGFTGTWEQRKLSEFAQRESAFRSSSFECPSIEYEDVVAEEGRLNKDVRLKDVQKSGIAFDGTQVLYGKLRPYLHNWLNPDFTGVAVGDWWVLQPVGIDKKFLYRLIQTQQFDDVANQSSGSKMPRADWNLVSNTEFTIPSSLDEQRQIAETFDSLDNLITLHQRKCEKLKNTKKYFLENMFPKNGENMPKIRFRGFTGTWEQRKLGDIAEFSKGQGYTKSDLRESGTPIILYGRLYMKYQPIIREVDTYTDEIPGAIFSKGGEVILPSSGETAEDIAIASSVDKSGFLLGGGLNIVLPHKELDSAFLAIEISFGTPHAELAKRAQGKSVVHLYNEDLKAVKISYPKIEEQKQISKMFENLDNLITLHQREVEKLQNIKKYYLEKMFI